MDQKPKHSIIPEEKLDIRSNTSQEAIKKTHLDIIRDFDVSEIRKEEMDDTQKKSEKMTFKKKREYIGDLVYNLDHLEYIYREKSDFKEVLNIIDYIIKRYKDILVRSDYIDIILKKSFALYRLGKCHNAYKELENISPYKQYFIENQSDDFYVIQGNSLFTIGENEQNKYFMQKALECFDHILQGANETHQLDPEFYRDIQYKRALIKVNLNEDVVAIAILEELISMSAYDDDIRANSFYLLGTIFDMLQKNQKAIDSFREYLKYRPDDQDIKQYIRILSERDSGE